MVSSLTFIIPACLACIYRQPVFAIVSFLTTMVSLNYWRDPVPGIRKTADFIVAKLSFFVYFYFAIIKIQWNIFCLCLCLCIFLLLVSFYLSCSFSQKKMKFPHLFLWVYFHFVFHMFVTCGQCMIVILYLYN